ncbi:DUF2935 domain-containing protein [Guptibacillus hwajinpoensis]|uniref:DUF2935 domain-containing protein n=1 Tax=Guptibacillus hwajinpoensis TaxID=208199 RepID=UPI0037352B3F
MSDEVTSDSAIFNCTILIYISVMINPTPLTPWQEHHFWIEILSDHAIFVRDYLSPSEHNYVNEANQFALAFDELHTQLKSLKRDEPASSDAMISFSRKAYNLARVVCFIQ